MTTLENWVVVVRNRCLWFLTGFLQEIRQRFFPPVFFSLPQESVACSLSKQTTYIFQSGQLHENEQVSLSLTQQNDTIQQLPSIYSGIGVGVYQGEIVTFRLMAIGERRWVVSKLRSEDLSQLPRQTLSEVCLELCLLRLHHTQPDLLMNGLRTTGGIELMKSLCPLAGNLDKLLKDGEVYSSPSIQELPDNQQQQNRLPLICLKCPLTYKPQSNIKDGGRQ
jgi:hypothetical protein